MWCCGVGVGVDVGWGRCRSPAPPPQDELHVVDSLALPAADGRLLLDVAAFRRWGESALIVDL